MLRSVMIAVAVACALPAIAEARPRAKSVIIECDHRGCSSQPYQGPIAGPARAVSAGLEVAAQMLPHPSGCPRRAFCGCGAAIRIFGSPRRDLWLAANWLRFPRAVPAPGRVAARRGHVFVLERHIGGDLWLVTDHNSGGHKSRLHVRSIRGFAIVNPQAGAA